MPINSRAKGASGERELAKKLTELGFPARRGQQFSGLEGKDICTAVAGLHIECKRVERLNLHKAVDQAIRDADDSELPVVVHRANGKPWLFTARLDDLLALLELLACWKTSNPTEKS
jgi:Holliday junction resolvase